MSNISQQIADLSPEKLELLLKLRNKKNENSQNKEITPQRRESGLLPLSFAQQRLWFLDQLMPENPLYNIPFGLCLSGQLDVLALSRSLNEIIRRHESLRTCFQTVDAQPTQWIADSLELTMPVIDLIELPEEKRQESARFLATVEAQQAFDLTELPLLRVKLLRLTPTEHVLLFVMHHIISDAWSLGVFNRELSVVYEALISGKPSPLAELSIQYADFAVWQQSWLQQQAQREQLQYWQQQLADIPYLQLPTDYSRPPVQSFAGATQILELPQNLKQALEKLSKQQGVTLFMTMLAAFCVLLQRYTGQTDIVVGSPIANRNRSSCEGLIGFFVNTLVLRTDLGGNPSFSELLSRVREVALSAYAHQDLPFEKLVEELQPERHLSHNPLFQVMFAVQNAPMEDLQLKGLQLSRLELEYKTTRVDLEWHVWEHPQGLEVMVAYATDLFAHQTIQRMLGHFQTLLSGVVANPQASLKQLPLLSATEQQQLLVHWNDTSADYPKHLCIHQLFEAQVAQTSDAVAVVFKDEQLTYNELNIKANKIAHHLQSLGVGPEVLVGLCVERSLDMVVGLLGILKAGGAYVPLDLAYPLERLAYMLSDASVSVLLTQAKQQNKLPQHSARIVCLDSNWSEIARESEENPTRQVTPDNLAYVMYTSGSTGKPKGVSIIHRCVVRLVKETNYANFSVEEVFLQLAPISFDASTFEIWGSLLNGGRLVVMPPHTPSLQELAQALGQYQVTTLWLTAGLFHLMVDSQLQSLKNLRQLLAGGDVLSVPHVLKVLLELKGCTLINGYGPTENTTFTCCHAITDSTQLGNSVPIGRPIANTQVYLLDEKLQPVPVGVPGDLYIGGDGLARGYLNRPDLTAEKFISNPFSDNPSVNVAGRDSALRLYKTGDRARYNCDGNIEFLGRLDTQVKIRGFRIELGEIEAILTQHPDVEETVVIARENIPGDKQLLAYIVSSQETAPTISDLRRFLKDKLPEYMMPSAIVMLEALPLTPNGKVDRSALPSPEASRAQLITAFVAPRTPIEEILVNLWAEVLGLLQVGIHDNFFELGGHSLLATQLISRVRDVLQLELPLRYLFEAPTPSELSDRIAVAQGQTCVVESSAIVPVARNTNLPLSFAQQRLWFLDQLMPANPFYNMPFALRLVGQLDVLALQHSLNEIIRRHSSLRTCFQTVDQQPRQLIADFWELTLATIDLIELPEAKREEQVRQLARIEAAQPFHLTELPLLRVKLLRLAPTEHVLLLVMHHIVSDGWSIGVFNRELSVLYQAFVAGLPSPLPELSIQYADFADWQRHWLQQSAQTEQLRYWQQHLADIAYLQLPTDYPRPPVQSFAGAIEILELPLNLKQALVKLSQQQGVTLFMTLLAAFCVLLHRYTGQTDIVVGSAIANRNRSEIESLIGFFVNSLVLRTDLVGNPSFSELLTRVREVALSAYAHQDYPFEKLVEELQPDRHLSHNPLFQVVFALQNAPMEELQLKGLQLSQLELEYNTTHVDLEWHVLEHPQGLEVVVAYATDLFAPETIRRMLGHFQTLLFGVVADPQASLKQLPLLSAVERHQILIDNDTKADYPKHLCIHQLFEAQVAQTSDAVAVVFKDEQLTYNELNIKANKIAHHLQSLGVGPEVLVGLCVERSLEMVVGLLGILKAGGAYVPLDPAYPTERLAFMLEDASVSVLLTQQRLLPLPSLGVKVVCLDGGWEKSGDGCALQHWQEIENNPSSGACADNLAYVIYTSGTTGLPKGVMVQHRGLLNLVFWHQQAFAVSPQDRVTQIATVAFDACGWEIWPYLTAGATIHFPDEETRLDPLRLRDWLVSNAITMSFLPTPLAEKILLLEWPKQVALRTLLTGGDKLNQYPHASHPFVVVNNYGPTENTVVTTSGPVPVSKQAERLPTIGRPIGNTSVYLLDEHLQLVPIGVPGELYISGDGQARGYLNRPELTAEKFIPNPLTNQPGARLYKTGDRARYNRDGNIEYLGRIDHQVKIRGFRIELGEIEAYLSQHPAVRETVVIARDFGSDKRIVAYIVPHSQSALKIENLWEFLKQKLPEYMVPSAFVMLSALPLTPNGKIDRQTLPVPEGSHARLSTTYVAPQSQLEQSIATIWQRVLHLQKMGIHDNFFDLGGHSLLLAEVHSQLRSLLHKEVSIVELFKYPTIRSLANYLSQKQSEQSSFEQNHQRANKKKEVINRHKQHRLQKG